MDDKPKFGVNAEKDVDKDTQNIIDNDRPIFGADSKVNEGQSVTAEASKPNFGTNAEIDDNPKPTFGTESLEGESNKTKKTVLEWIINIFKMQPMSFWIKQYFFAIVGYVIFNSLSSDGEYVGVMNLILYPFTVTILQEIGRGLGSQGTLGEFFFGYSVAMMDESLFYIGFYTFVRFIIFMIKYVFSLVIGPIGLIYMLLQAKKINQ